MSRFSNKGQGPHISICRGSPLRLVPAAGCAAPAGDSSISSSWPLAPSPAFAILHRSQGMLRASLRVLPRDVTGQSESLAAVHIWSSFRR